jgi:DNA-binding NtrC family response regulator
MNGEDCPHRQVFATGEPHQVLHVHYNGDAQPEHLRIKAAPIFAPDGTQYLGESLFPFTHAEDLDCEQHLLVGKSKAFLACVESLVRAADTDAPVLLHGESGVGKELAAQYVHSRSQRREHPFVQVDCRAFSASALEDELFGNEAGKFDGDSSRRRCLFEQADGGTLFLGEIGEIPAALQGKLLRAIETGRFTRTGGHEPLSMDLRTISASSEKLSQKVSAGDFRADLYYHLSGMICEIPPLRRRREDIAELSHALLKRMGTNGDPSYRLTDDAVKTLTRYDYPGNLRELRNLLRRAMSLSTNGIITAGEIQMAGSPGGQAVGAEACIEGNGGEEPSMKDLESRYIAELLAEHRGRRAKVAEILGISERTLYRKLKLYGLQSVGRAP